MDFFGTENHFNLFNLVRICCNLDFLEKVVLQRRSPAERTETVATISFCAGKLEMETAIFQELNIILGFRSLKMIKEGLCIVFMYC